MVSQKPITKMDVVSKISIINTAIQDKKCLKFIYFKKDKKTDETQIEKRIIEPKRIGEHGTKNTILFGYDLDREHWRSFNLDNISELQFTAKECKHTDPRYYWVFYVMLKSRFYVPYIVKYGTIVITDMTPIEWQEKQSKRGERYQIINWKRLDNYEYNASKIC